MSELVKIESAENSLLSDLRSLIEDARQRVASTVNAELTMLYWNVGKRINDEILQNERADYGKEIVASLSRQLTADYGKGFDKPNLSRMIKFAEFFPDKPIVVTLSQQLSWSHFLAILPVKNDLGREFYAAMSVNERWSVRTLRERVDSMLFERTAISRKPEETIKNDLALLRDEQKLTPDLVFRDPYFLEFLNLADNYSEKDLENAILSELERFLLELGSDFSFVARQKRIVIDDEDYYLDLLFYHRGLRRLILFELKIGKLKAGDTGQTELYLRWLDKYERRTGEDAPLAVILCTEKGGQMIELLELEQRGIRVAEYLTELPPREILERKLLEAVRLAKLQQENK